MFSFPFLRKKSRAGSSSENTLVRLGRVLNKLEPGSISGELRGLDCATMLEGIEAMPPPERRQGAGLQPLIFPLKSARKIAVLRPGFSLPSSAREFAANDSAGMHAWQPDALVAPLNTALLLADHKLTGRFPLPSLETALIVTTRIDDAPLAPHHRDLLWRAFEVPVFEQLLSWDGCVIARECELHCGLHLADDTVIATLRDDELLLTHLNHVEEPIVLARTGYSALMSKDPCDCGAATARLGCLTPVRTRVRAASPGSTD